MIAFRKARPSIARSSYWREDVHWYGANGPVDFAPESRSVGYCLHGESNLYVMINAWWQPIRFHIQEGAAEEWKRVVDTSCARPDDIADPGSGRPLGSLDYEVAPRSVVVLEST
jgi:glycogen operon protein